jgi:hypothetical protein
MLSERGNFTTGLKSELEKENVVCQVYQKKIKTSQLNIEGRKFLFTKDSFKHLYLIM